MQQMALLGIEQANPETLYGIFGEAQWTNKDHLFDALLHEHVERIHGWYQAYQKVAGITRKVYNLNIPRHIGPVVKQEVLTVEEAMQSFQAGAEAAFAVEEKLIVLRKRDGLLL